MLAQLDRLLSVSLLPNVRVGLVPLGVQIDTAVQNSFVMYDDFVRVESFVAEEEYRGEVAARYERVLELLWAQAVEGDGARQIILRAAQDLRKRGIHSP